VAGSRRDFWAQNRRDHFAVTNKRGQPGKRIRELHIMTGQIAPPRSPRICARGIGPPEQRSAATQSETSLRFVE